MQRVQGPNRTWEGFDRASQDRASKLDERDPTHQQLGRLSVRRRQGARMNASPELVFEQTTCDKGLFPKVVQLHDVLGLRIGAYAPSSPQA
jgi:hypothetical protein